MDDARVYVLTIQEARDVVADVVSASTDADRIAFGCVCVPLLAIIGQGMVCPSCSADTDAYVKSHGGTSGPGV